MSQAKDEPKTSQTTKAKAASKTSAAAKAKDVPKTSHVSKGKEVPKPQTAKGKQNAKVKPPTKGPGELQHLKLSSPCSFLLLCVTEI